MRFNRYHKQSLLWLFIFLTVFSTCTIEKDKVTEQTIKVDVPAFNPDSAYFFIDRLVKFGPRIPNSEAHHFAEDYLFNQLSISGASVTKQEFVAATFDNQKLDLSNIIASFNTKASKRILLAAHWDTRPFADKDTQDKNAQFEGANDGASGVGILLEVARILSQQDSLSIGIDIILFDGEDWGEREGDQNSDLPEGLDSWWCLGSQYWSKNKHKKNYTASYGILLDMVGARRSQFFREGESMKYAPKVVDKVWSMANHLGYSDYFVKQNVPSIIDDHLYVNQFAKIPMIDIVHYQTGIGFFGEYHHSTKDNMSLISKETLMAVGTTLLYIIYNEEP